MMSMMRLAFPPPASAADIAPDGPIATTTSSATGRPGAELRLEVLGRASPAAHKMTGWVFVALTTVTLSTAAVAVVGTPPEPAMVTSIGCPLSRLPALGLRPGRVCSNRFGVRGTKPPAALPGAYQPLMATITSTGPALAYTSTVPLAGTSTMTELDTILP